MRGGNVLMADANGRIENASGPGVGFVLQSGHIYGTTPLEDAVAEELAPQSIAGQGMPGCFPVRVRLHHSTTDELTVYNSEAFRFAQGFETFDILGARPYHCYRVITLTDPAEGFIPGQQRVRVPFWLWNGQAGAAAAALNAVDALEWSYATAYMAWLPPNVVGYNVVVDGMDGGELGMWARSRTTGVWSLVETWTDAEVNSEYLSSTYFDASLAWGHLAFKMVSGATRPWVTLEGVAECY